MASTPHPLRKLAMRMDRTERISNDVTKPKTAPGKGYAANASFAAGDYKTANSMQKMDSQPEFIKPETMKKYDPREPLKKRMGTLASDRPSPGYSHND